MKKAKKDKQEVNDPVITYKKSLIKAFTSFEEANLFEQNKILLEPPLHRISQTVDLILRIYGFSRETLLQRKPVNKIIIDK